MAATAANNFTGMLLLRKKNYDFVLEPSVFLPFLLFWVTSLFPAIYTLIF